MTNLGLGHTLAGLIGPGIGGLLSRWGIIAPGLFAAALTIVAFIATITMFKESNPFAQSLSQTRSSPKTPLDTKKSTQKVWQNPLTMYLLIQWAFHTLAFTIFMSTLSLFAFIRFGLNAEQVGLLLMIGGLFRVIIRVFFFMPILNRLGERITSILGLTIFTIIFFLLSFVTAEIQFLLILVASSFAASCARGVLNSFLSRSVSPKDQGKIMGMATSMDNFSQIVGPIIGGFFLGSLDLVWFGLMLAFFSVIPFAMSFRKLEFEADSNSPQIFSKKELLDSD
jgi:DHA1 family multidrug resistance protein-like MFS transporter